MEGQPGPHSTVGSTGPVRGFPFLSGRRVHRLKVKKMFLEEFPYWMCEVGLIPPSLTSAWPRLEEGTTAPLPFSTAEAIATDKLR